MSSLGAANLAATGATVGVTHLLLRSKKGEIGSIELDATVRELHGASAQVTAHPVEATGEIAAGEINDHIRVDPLVITIDGVITNHPTIFGGAIATLLAGGSFTPDKDAHSKLLDYLQLGRIVTVVTTLKTYEDMALESLSVERDAGKGNSLHFNARLKQITKVELETTGGIGLGGSKPPALSTKSAGKIAKNPPAGSVSAKASVLSATIKAAKGLFGG